MDIEIVPRNECYRTDCALSMSTEFGQLFNQTRTTQKWFTGLHVPICVLATKCKSHILLFEQTFVINSRNQCRCNVGPEIICHSLLFSPFFLFRKFAQRLKCQRKEPCKLFTVRKRQELLDEVNTNPLCQCPRNHRCPRLHTDSGVISGKSYIEDNIRTYSGYCMPNI